MSQCVPNWDHEDPPNPSPHLPSTSTHTQVPMSDYEVAELTWKNGHLSTHGLSHPRIGKPIPRYPSTAGTLESVVDQAKLLQPSSFWLAGEPHHHLTAIDAVVPNRRHGDDLASGNGSCEGGSGERKPVRVGEGGGSLDSTRVTDTCGTDEFGFTTTNSATAFPEDGGGSGRSPDDTENTSFGGGSGSRRLTATDDYSSFCHSRRSQSQREVMGREEEEKATGGGTVRSTVSMKRSRAATVHNQSERKRRDRINQRMRTLQKLVPNSSKIDKASMLDEVIEYLKQLQAQVQMMSRISSISPMMMPMSMQQYQMSMMAQMAYMAQMTQMGMGMGMMDMNTLGRPGHAGISPVLPTSAFFPMVGGSWDPSSDWMQQPSGSVMPDPFSAFHACPTQQPMRMDAYQRIAALYQQLFQPTPPTNPK